MYRKNYHIGELANDYIDEITELQKIIDVSGGSLGDILNENSSDFDTSEVCSECDR